MDDITNPSEITNLALDAVARILKFRGAPKSLQARVAIAVLKLAAKHLHASKDPPGRIPDLQRNPGDPQTDPCDLDDETRLRELRNAVADIYGFDLKTGEAVADARYLPDTCTSASIDECTSASIDQCTSACTT